MFRSSQGIHLRFFILMDTLSPVILTEFVHHPVFDVKNLQNSYRDFPPNKIFTGIDSFIGKMSKSLLGGPIIWLVIEKSFDRNWSVKWWKRGHTGSSLKNLPGKPKKGQKHEFSLQKQPKNLGLTKVNTWKIVLLMTRNRWKWLTRFESLQGL